MVPPPDAHPVAGQPLLVRLSSEQPHPIDLRWVDELVASARPHLMVRPEDELLILVPNTPIKLNRTALRVLAPMVNERAGIAEVLAREGDSPRRRAEIHYFFSDLKAWLEGRLGEGEGRRAVVRGCRPLIDGGNPQIALGARETQQTVVAYGAPVGLTPAGLAPVMQSGRYFRVRATLQAGDSWSNMQGVDDLDVRPAGRQ